MRLLALDIGSKRTGIAYFDDETSIPLPLTTLAHGSDDALVAAILSLAEERKIDRVIAGLPLLPSGRIGSQAKAAEKLVETLRKKGLDVFFLDERYTSGTQKDADAHAALSLLQTYLERNQKRDKK